MSQRFPRPDEKHLHVERESTDRECPECGSDDVRQYPVLSEDGWVMATKCQGCLHSLERTDRESPYGEWTPYTDLID